MGKSPGHRKWPNHKVEEERPRKRIVAKIEGEALADSRDVIRVNEDDDPARFYFPRSDVRMDHLQRTSTTTGCPFKGTAHYFNLKVGSRTFEDAVWTYEDPYDEHKALKGRLAFDEDKIPGIRLTDRWEAA